MSTRPTMKDIAQAAGVSIATVSAVLNGGSDRITFSPETEQRVRKHVRKLGYRINQQGRRLRRGRSDTLGVVLDDLSIPFMAELIHAIGRALEPRNLSLMLFDLPDLTHARQQLEKLFIQGRVDGILLGGATDTLPEKDILALDRAGYPIVTIERRIAGCSIPSVQVDNHLGGKLAVERLLTQPTDHLYILSGPGNAPTVQARRAGATQAWTDAGRPTENIHCLGNSWCARDAYHVIKNLLTNTDPSELQLIFAMNDQLASGALLALHEAGTTARIVGFDDSPAAEFCIPPLTTLRQPVQDMADAAIELLTARIEKQPIANPNRTFAPTLIARQSG